MTFLFNTYTHDCLIPLASEDIKGSVWQCDGCPRKWRLEYTFANTLEWVSISNAEAEAWINNWSDAR